MSAYQLTELTALVDLALLVFTSGLGLAVFHRLKPAFSYLMVYLWGATLVELIAKLYYFGWLSGSNLWLLQAYTMFEFVVLALLYREVLGLQLRQRKGYTLGLGALAIALAAYAATTFVRQPDPSAFQLYSKIVVHGTVMALSAALLVRVLKAPERYLENFRGLLPVNSALLLYYAGSFAIFLTMRYAIAHQLEQSVWLWLINVLLTLVLHVVCIFGLWAKDSRTAPS